MKKRIQMLAACDQSRPNLAKPFGIEGEAICFCDDNDDPAILIMPWRSDDLGAKLEELEVI